MPSRINLAKRRRKTKKLLDLSVKPKKSPTSSDFLGS